MTVQEPEADDLAGGIDGVRKLESPTGARTDQVIEILHAGGFGPYEGAIVWIVANHTYNANDLA